ncbi:hypothetical protein OG331_49730 [Streptomyces sp. NBC_01017]|uniref:Uncharacterized protein n=1 Tax=Streptomyces sp. NBC_00180 TaxID=2903632 RepID=A0AAU1I970_9ACTN|nr:hypothetical protein OG331_02245 [Streptomyces sp. NBC_01017]WSV35059.1 hypothetical protein OG331_49730 [Streptomyces sp. NBC_01017]
MVAWETSHKADADLVLTVLEYALASAAQPRALTLNPSVTRLEQPER